MLKMLGRSMELREDFNRNDRVVTNLQNRKKRQHTVPRLFLSAWASEGQLDAIHKDTGRVIPQSIANASVETQFHVPDEFANLPDPQFMEDNLGRFESSVARSVKEAATGHSWQNDAHVREEVADFVALLAVRSPRTRLEIAERGSTVGVDDDNPGSDALRRAAYMISGVDSGVPLEDGSPAYRHITEMAQLFLAIRPAIANAEWLILDFDTPQLVSSDAPVSFVSNFRKDSWFGNEEVTVTALSLSPTRALLLRHTAEGAAPELANHRTLVGSEDDALLVNSLTWHFAVRWLFKHPYSAVKLGRLTGAEPKLQTFQANNGDARSGLTRWHWRTGHLSTQDAAQEFAGARLFDGQVSEPLGAAIVLTAYHWRRMGMTDLSRQEAVDLTLRCMPPEEQAVYSTNRFRALAWAEAGGDGVEPLLNSSPDSLITRCGDSIFDFLLQREGVFDTLEPPEPLWELAAAMANTGIELQSLAATAHDFGRLELAISLLRKAVGNSDGSAGEAQFNLGVIEELVEDSTAARRTYRAVIESRDMEYSPKAAVNLGVLERRLGRLPEARKAYRKAISFGCAEQTAMALVNLGNLERNVGRVAAARAAYRKASQIAHPEEMPKASYLLGEVEEGAGREFAALEAYRQAIDTGHVRWAPLAAMRAGDIEWRGHRDEGARGFYQFVIASEDDWSSPAAALHLGQLELEHGNPEAAREALNHAVAADTHPASLAATLILGALDAENGRFEDARTAYWKAVELSEPPISSMAAFRLLELEIRERNVEAARQAYERVATSEIAELIPVAAFNLGSLERDVGHRAAARNAYEVAAGSMDVGLAEAARQALQDLNGECSPVPDA